MRLSVLEMRSPSQPPPLLSEPPRPPLSCTSPPMRSGSRPTLPAREFPVASALGMLSLRSSTRPPAVCVRPVPVAVAVVALPLGRGLLLPCEFGSLFGLQHGFELLDFRSAFLQLFLGLPPEPGEALPLSRWPFRGLAPDPPRSLFPSALRPAIAASSCAVISVRRAALCLAELSHSSFLRVRSAISVPCMAYFVFQLCVVGRNLVSVSYASCSRKARSCWSSESAPVFALLPEPLPAVPPRSLRV